MGLKAPVLLAIFASDAELRLKPLLPTPMDKQPFLRRVAQVTLLPHSVPSESEFLKQLSD
jgi:hypothetical protein